MRSKNFVLLDMPRLGLASFRRRILVRVVFLLLAIATILLGVTLMDGPQLPATLLFVTTAAGKTFGFMLLSVGLTAYAKASGVDNLISRAFTGPPLLAVVSAALMGALSPFCSCGVIPIIVALLAMGVPLAPVMAFWLASPLMDPSMFVMTASVLGVMARCSAQAALASPCASSRSIAAARRCSSP